MSRQNSCRQIAQSGEMRILASSFSTITVAFLVAFFVLIMVMASKSILKSVSTEPLITRRSCGSNPFPAIEKKKRHIVPFFFLLIGK